MYPGITILPLLLFLSSAGDLTDGGLADRLSFINRYRQLKFSARECLFTKQIENACLDFKDITTRPAYPNKRVNTAGHRQQNHHGDVSHAGCPAAGG